MGFCHLPGESDYYNTKPFGDLEPVLPAPQQQNPYQIMDFPIPKFYHEEFEPLKFESDGL